jgi:hypothetical protein
MMIKEFLLDLSAFSFEPSSGRQAKFQRSVFSSFLRKKQKCRQNHHLFSKLPL